MQVQSGKRWYVVAAIDGKDFDVCLRLAAAGFEVWRPVEKRAFKRRVKTSWGEKLVPAERSVARFGRYVFLHVVMNDSVFASVRHAPGVRDFVHLAGGDDPAAVPEAVIAVLREKIANSENAFGFKKMDRVRFVDGAFEGLCADVVDVDSRGVPMLEMMVFGGKTCFPIDPSRIVLVERPAPQKTGARKARR